MKVLITGAAGVIGIELAKKCDKAGLQVLGIDKKEKPHQWPKGHEFIQENLVTMRMENLGKFAPEVVFHLAASFERTEESPAFYFINQDDNLRLSSRLLDYAMSCQSVHTYIFASSYLVYDSDQYLVSNTVGTPMALSEHSTLRPRNLIGAAKLFHESEIEFMRGFFDSKRLISARIFRGFGRGSRDIISRWVRAGLSGNKIMVYNDQSSFDFIFSEESAELLLAMANQHVPGGIYNVGSGMSTSISEIVQIISEIFPHIGVEKLEGGGPLIEKSRADTQKLFRYVERLAPPDPKSRIANLVDFESAAAEVALE